MERDCCLSVFNRCDVCFSYNISAVTAEFMFLLIKLYYSLFQNRAHSVAVDFPVPVVYSSSGSN